MLEGRDFEVYGQYFNVIQGKKGIIKGFDEHFHKVHPAFNTLFTHKYICYGLPAADYKIETCYKCKKRYISQAFKTNCNGHEYNAYAWANNCSRGGSCDDLGLETVKPCRLSEKNIVLGVDF